jgi:peroxiredoxin
MSDAFDARKIVAYVIVSILIGILTVQYVRALGPSTRDDRMAGCRALNPQQFNPRLGKFPAHAVDFRAEDIDGKPVSLSDHRGRVVFLNFWQTKCRPCIEEMPSMERLQRQFQDRGLEVLALASESSFDPVHQFFGGARTAMTVLLDPPDEDSAVGRISRRYGTEKWPETYLIDKRGVVRYYYINQRDWNSDKAHKCIQALLDE